jgi:hypothetical protein
MATDFTPPPWDDALYGFIQHLRGTSCAAKTVKFYHTQLRACKRITSRISRPILAHAERWCSSIAGRQHAG